jgi:6-phosphogluconolactonase
MEFIHSTDSQDGSASLADRISATLTSNKPVLWLVCGGSNVPVAFNIFKSIKAQVASGSLALLTVGQTDERFGPVGHADSNWQQLIEIGFDFNTVKSLPILIGKPLKETIAAYSNTIEAAIDDVKGSGGSIIALFGIGSDGHIAGILPHSSAVGSNEPVCGYEAGKFTRITLTPKTLKRIDLAYAFAFGDSKKEAIENLRDKELSIDDEPAQILKGLKEAFMYSDEVRPI